MKRNDKIDMIIGCIFIAPFLYFLYISENLYALGWLLLSLTMFLGSYTPKKTDRREVFILINVILPFLAVGIFFYRLIHG